MSSESGATGRRRRSWRGGSGNLVTGGTIVVLVVLLALVSLVWTPYDPIPVNPAGRLLGMTSAHPLGTDLYGRDVVSLLMYGARISLLVGVAAVVIAMVIGVPVGVLAGMRGGWVDQVLMRATDVALAFPALLLTIVFGAVWGAGTTTAVIALGISAAPSFARVSRSGTLQIMSREYVVAARAANRGPFWIATRHVLPNIAGLVIVQSSVAFGIAVLAEAALSYLGFGTTPPTPSWGRMLQEGQSYLFDHPMLVLWPGIAIALTVLGLNLLGDGLRDRLDPRAGGAR
ncbi:ABC transporter permease [Prauserella cavernicola]|uniref:ABC transporter permease n=1 Tax=Prauserella cavernicola TaxID=2800127 RepID=UPI003558C8B5